MAAPQLRLEVSLNLLGFRNEIRKLTNIAQSEFVPKINVKFNRQTLDAELNNLQRAIKRRVYRVEIGGNIDALPSKIKNLKEQLASIESLKIDLGIGAVKSLSKRDASKIKSDLRAEILGEQKKIYVPVSIKPSIVKKDVLDFKNTVQSKLSGITVKVKADLEAASISGGAKSRADINADVRRKLQEISEIGAQRMAGGGGGVTEAARRAQLKRSLETGGFDIGGLKDIGKQLGVAGVGRFKNVNNLIEKIVTESSIEMVKKYLDPQAVMRNPDRSGLGKVLDTFARGIFNMLGMDPASIRAQQQSSKPKPFAPAGLLPAFTLKGAREEMMRQLTEGISSSAAGGGGRDGKLALTNASNMAVQSVKVREIFDPREFEFATLRLFRVIGDALESASNQAESASNQAKNARIDQSVGALMQSIDNAIKVGRARVRNVSSLLSGKVDVRDLGRSNLLKGVSPVGLLPPAVGRAPGAYRSSSGESQEELFTRRTREAYINSAARAADASQSPLALPPARDRVLGQPPLMTAPSIGGSRARPMGMTGSAPPDGPSGGGAEANAFVDASRKALAYNQALTGLRESIRGVQVAQLPLIGGIKGLAGEFGQATKQVLLYGTAYKGLAFLTSLPGEAFNAAKALGTYKNQLQAVTSETGTFSNSLAFVDNLAQRFNVPLESARQGFVKLYASMQPTGFSQEQIEGLFTGISQASAAFGLSADKVDRVNYAFAQMASKGQIMSEELKGQLGDVLPGALSLFAEAAKMSIPEFSKAMEDGAFKAEAMMQVLENVGILMKVKFGAAATGAAKTLQGALNGIQNNLKLMYEAFGPVVNRMAAVFGPKITSLIKNVTDVIKAFEAGVSTTGDSFAAMSPQAQGFYSSIQNALPPIKALIPSLAAAAKNIGYFASSLATASQPLMGLLKLALDFISIPFVARVGVYATVISVLTSAFTLLKNTGIIQATIAMVRFIATLTVGQVQAWISSIQAAITALVAMARTANIAKLSLMALKVTLISFGVGAVLLGLDFVVQKLFNIGSAADDAKRRTAELTDELARAAETGNVAVTSAKLVETETKVQSLQESKKILQRLQSGGEVPLSEQDYQRLQRAGLAQGISRSLDPLTGKPTGKGRAAGGSSQINESLRVVQSGLVSALNDAGRAAEANADALQVQGNMQRQLDASRSQMKDIPPATGADGDAGAAKIKDKQKYVSDMAKLLQQEMQQKINAISQDASISDREREIQAAATRYDYELLMNKAEYNAGINDENKKDILSRGQYLADLQKTLKAENELSRQRYEDIVTSPLRDMLSEDRKAIIDLEATEKMISEARTERTQVEQRESEIKQALVGLDEKQIQVLQPLIDLILKTAAARDKLTEANKRNLAFTEKMNELKNQLALAQILDPRAERRAQIKQETPGLSDAQVESRAALEEQVAAAAKSRDQLRSIASSIGNSFGEAFKGIITGSMTAQEALAGMFQSIADHFADMVAQMIAEWLKAQLIEGIMNIVSMFSPGFGTGIAPGPVAKSAGVKFSPTKMGPAFANGGIAPGGFTAFANGGMVTGPTMGLVGEGRYNEAIVPLPDGKSIPVELAGGGSSSPTVIINVDAKGSQVEGNEQNANQLGRVISAAVQTELIKQQRPGGLLAR
jgi:tape measure domain-containing protein